MTTEDRIQDAIETLKSETNEDKRQSAIDTLNENGFNPSDFGVVGVAKKTCDVATAYAEKAYKLYSDYEKKLEAIYGITIMMRDQASMKIGERRTLQRKFNKFVDECEANDIDPATIIQKILSN